MIKHNKNRKDIFEKKFHLEQIIFPLNIMIHN